MKTLANKGGHIVDRPAGSYELYVSGGTGMGTSQIALPLPDSDGSRRYRLGTLKVQKKSKNC